VPYESRIGRFSPVLWRIRSEQWPGRELYRPLPISDVDLTLYESLLQTLEGFGFNVQGWTGEPDLRLRVEVERLVLQSEDGGKPLRACEAVADLPPRGASERTGDRVLREPGSP